MRLIVCLDDRNGMMFNGRRQSQDKNLRKEMLLLTKCTQLWMNSYSASQFESIPDYVTVREDFLKSAPENVCCFVENEDITRYLNKISSVVIYRWNRCYPSDQILPVDAVLTGRKLIGCREFVGNSHEKITEEVYA